MLKQPIPGSSELAAIRAALVRWRVPLLVLGLAGLTAGAIYQLRAGINPQSLALDDQWVAVLVKHASLPVLVDLRAPVPIGFILLLKAMTAALGWGSWQLQLLPLLCGLAQIPLVGWIAYRLTDRVSLGLFASVLLMGSTTLAVYSLRAKQFTLEGLIALVLIALVLLWLRRPRAWTLGVLLAAAVAAIAVSITAVLVGLVIVNMLGLHAIRARTDERGVSKAAVAVSCATYDAIAVGLILLLARQRNAVLLESWRDHFLPLGDVSALWAFVSTDGVRFFTGAMPSAMGWLALGVPVGMVLLCRRRETRMIGLALLAFYGAIFAANALRLYPLGGRRTDIFSYPVTVLAVTGAVWALGRWVRFLPQVALVVVLSELILFFPRASVGYSGGVAREVLEMANEVVDEGDGLIVAPCTNWAIGCYGRWPVRLERAEVSSTGYFVALERPETLVFTESLVGLDPRWSDSSRAELDAFLAGAPSRVVFVSTGLRQVRDEEIGRTIESHGYIARPLAAPAPATLCVYERASEASAE